MTPDQLLSILQNHFIYIFPTQLQDAWIDPINDTLSATKTNFDCRPYTTRDNTCFLGSMLFCSYSNDPEVNLSLFIEWGSTRRLISQSDEDADLSFFPPVEADDLQAALGSFPQVVDLLTELSLWVAENQPSFVQFVEFILLRSEKWSIKYIGEKPTEWPSSRNNLSLEEL